jgi:hypothetical protein
MAGRLTAWPPFQAHRAATTFPATFSCSFFNVNLCWLGRRNLGRPAMGRYRARDAGMLVSALIFRFAKLGSVVSPNHDCEYLFWIRLIKIQESRLSLAPVRIPSAGNGAANYRLFADMTFRLSRRDLFCLSVNGEGWDETETQEQQEFRNLQLCPSLFRT